MSKVKVASFSVSMDGFGAGPHQDLHHPLGVRGTELFEWFFKTQVFQRTVMNREGGTTDADNSVAEKAIENIGAWILGRNMFGPVRGSWDESWKGWWGDTPPYHVPVFILTHHPRAPLKMEGGTTFYFVTDGIQSALKQAKEAAKGKDVRIGGGVATIRQFLNANLIDEMHLAFSPVILGTGENLFSGIDLSKLGFKVTERLATELATHLFLKK